MGNFVGRDPLLERGGVVVARGPERRGKPGRVLQIRSLETHAHERDEAELVRNARHSFPEPVTHREGADGEPQSLDVRLIKLHVADLVAGDAHETSAKLGLRAGERQQRPTHELGRLELVVPERVEQSRAVQRVRKGGRLGRTYGASHDPKPC